MNSDEFGLIATLQGELDGHGYGHGYGRGGAWMGMFAPKTVGMDGHGGAWLWA